MRPLVIGLVAGSVVLAAWFVLALGPPYRSENQATTWLLATWGWVSLIFETLLLLALLQISVPWLFAVVVLAAQDAVWVWWLVRLHRSRRAVRAEE